MKKFSLLLFVFIISSVAIFAQEVHEMENMRVSINAIESKNTRSIETTKNNGKDYIAGKSSCYNKNGQAKGGKLLWPYAEYAIESKLSGGDYIITVFYKIDSKNAPSDAKILVGMDLLEAEELAVEKKLLNNSVKATFSPKLLKGKNHTLKIWLPSKGVEIDRFEVRRALIKKKD